MLTNPPFGKKSSVTYVTDGGEIRRESQTIVRDDFWTSTSNKQLNFVKSFTLKQNPLTREDLDEFVACYNPDNRHERTPMSRSEEGREERVLTQARPATCGGRHRSPGGMSPAHRTRRRWSHYITDGRMVKARSDHPKGRPVQPLVRPRYLTMR